MSYALAFQAILDKKPADFQTLLRSNPAILDEADNYGDTLLHHAAAYSPQIARIILDHLVTAGKQDQILRVNHYDRSALHRAVLFNEPDSVQAIVTALGPDRAIIAAKMCDRGGSFPLMLSSRKEEDDPIFRILLPLTLNCSIKPFKTLLNPEEVIKEFPGDKRLHENIREACEAINETRRVIDECYTHPQLNARPYAERLAVRTNLLKARDEINVEIAKIASPTDQQKIDTDDTVCRQAKIANCAELASITARLLKQHNKRVNVYAIEGDDHIFVVYDREHKEFKSRFGNLVDNKFDHTNWGPYALIVDPWSGAVYPATQALRNLMTFHLFEFKPTTGPATDECNILASFNPRYHRLVPTRTIEPPSSAPMTTLTAASASSPALDKSAAIPATTPAGTTAPATATAPAATTAPATATTPAAVTTTADVDVPIAIRSPSAAPSIASGPTATSGLSRIIKIGTPPAAARTNLFSTKTSGRRIQLAKLQKYPQASSVSAPFLRKSFTLFSGGQTISGSTAPAASAAPPALTASTGF